MKIVQFLLDYIEYIIGISLKFRINKFLEYWFDNNLPATRYCQIEKDWV
jgi:hypothetical protein